MILWRTTNAGMLIKLDDISVLLDGVAEELPPYEETPLAITESLLQTPPDIVLYTHNHKDHYDLSFARRYNLATGRSAHVAEDDFYRKSGDTEIFSQKTRHIGKTDVNHVSYVIKGSKCVWFMGDASPLELKKFGQFPKPDVLVVPYAYTVTESAWKSALATDADTIILLHLPRRENDEYGLWNMTSDVTRGDSRLYIPKVGEKIEI